MQNRIELFDDNIGTSAQYVGTAAESRVRTVRAIGAGAHLTIPPKVVLSPRTPRRSNFKNNVRVALTSVAFIGLAWLTGVGIAA